MTVQDPAHVREEEGVGEVVDIRVQEPSECSVELWDMKWHVAADS